METTPENPVPPPPPAPAPPVIVPATPTPPARKGRGWMIAALLSVVLLGLSVLLNLTQFVAHGLNFNRSFKPGTPRQLGPKLDECILEDNKSHNKIAVIEVTGIITSMPGEDGNTMVDMIKAQLDEADDDDRVKAVILKVDSPGGEVMAADEIHKAIVDFEADDATEAGQPAGKGKPVICSMGSLAASGGYYIAAPCRWIEANELTLTGSIGVIMHGYNYRGLMDKLGVEPMTFKSGKFKDMLSPDRATNEIPAEEHAMVQGLIDETFARFKDIVDDGRTKAHEENKKEGHPLAYDWQDYADGRVLSGTQALKLGFVDELGDFDDAVERAEKIADIKNANLVEYQEHYDISDFLSMFGQSSSAHTVKLDLGIDIPKLRAGCPYFLWQPSGD